MQHTVYFAIEAFAFSREHLCLAWCGAMAHLAGADADAMVFSVKSAGEKQPVESIDALNVLSMLVTLLRTPALLPKHVHVCVCGQTDLALAGLHHHFDHHVPTSDFAMKMQSRQCNAAYLLFDLTSLLQDNPIHGVFHHTLDGHCLLDNFRRARALDPLQDLSLVALCVVLLWLQKLKDKDHAFILCMCGQGKHRSQYMARLLWLGLDLVKRTQRSHFDLHYTWVSEDRIMKAQWNRKERQQKQHPDCCFDVVRGWHRFYASYQFISVVLSDALHAESCATNQKGAQEFSLQVCLQKLKLEPVGDIKSLLGNNEKDLIKFSSLMHRFNTLKSWVFLVRQGMAALWPEQCSICSLKKRLPWTWREDIPVFFHNVILAAQQACAAADQQDGKLAPERKVAWADIEDDIEDSSEEDEVQRKKRKITQKPKSCASVSLRTAGESTSSQSQGSAAGESNFSKSQSSAGASLRTARESSASQLPARSALRSTQQRTLGSRVRFADPDPDVEFVSETDEYWQMKIDLEARVVLSFEQSSLADTEARKNVALKMKTSSGYPYLVTNTNAPRSLLSKAAKHLMDCDDRFYSEVGFLKERVAECGIPFTFDSSMSALHLIELLVFLHLVSILLSDHFMPFGLTYYFVDAAGKCFSEMAGVDIFQLMARYVYLLWLAPPMDNESWNRGFFGLLIPRNKLTSVQWWNLMQTAINSCPESAFREEYCCLTEVLNEKFTLQIKEIEERFKRSPVRVPPSLPDHMHWIQHDAAVNVESGLTLPRVLQPFRVSASTVEGHWGNDNGSQLEVTRENCVSECHCCFIAADAKLPYDITLAHLLTDAFPACNLPLPWWLPVPTRGAMARAEASKPLQESPTEKHMYAIQYRVLGGLLLSTLKPDNVMHPHLRCHFEYHVGKLLSLEIFRNSLGNVLVSDFMRGCGIVFGTGSGWLEAKVRKRAAAGVPLHGLLVHTVWGEKCRVQRYLDPENEDDTIFLIPTSCPNQDRNNLPCKNHFEMCGYGSLCNGYHGFSERYSRQLMFHALHYTECRGVARRGRAGPEGNDRGLGFVYEMAGEMGLHCEQNEQYHSNPERRLRIFDLPRWLPRFYGVDVRNRLPGSHFDHMAPCGRKCFLKEDIDRCHSVEEMQRKRFIEFEKLVLRLGRKSSCRGVFVLND